jgi:16S rRNA (guanine966-N2)-methyltransferase
MSSRVIGGSAKGQRLKLVPGNSTRPIMDKVKESLFNIIGTNIVGANFLDLYSGTGAVGIEALSRGADYAMFTEIDRIALKTINENLASTKLKTRAEIRMVNALDLLKNPPQKVFDFIFIAPPQYKNMWLETLRALDGNPSWLAPHTIVVVQIDPQERNDVLFDHLRAYDERRYGRTLLWFFEVISDEEVEE